MAYIRKKGNRWIAEARVMRHHNAYSDSKSFASKSEAQIWAWQREDELKRSADNIIDDTKTLRDALIRYRDEVSPTKKGARWEIIRINKFLNDQNLNTFIKMSNLSTKFFIEWRQTLTVSASSKNREMTVLRSVIEMARREWFWIANNPIRDIRSLSEPPPRDRRIADYEINAILKVLEFRDVPPTSKKETIAVIFLFALETAMRLSEICTLKWENVHLSACYVSLPETKNSDRRNVALSTQAHHLLQLMSPQSQGSVFGMISDNVSALFRMYRDQAKYFEEIVIDGEKRLEPRSIENLTFHDTRHEAITRLAQKLDVLDLARMTGHRDIRSLMIYYNMSATEMAKKLN